MPARDQRLLAGAAIVTALAFLALALVGHGELVAYLLPVAIVALPLVAGRYPGGDRLARLQARRRASRRVRPTTESVPASARRPAGALARGGRLIADALAVRPPPSLAVR
jgi:hypothetical protein